MNSFLSLSLSLYSLFWMPPKISCGLTLLAARWLVANLTRWVTEVTVPYLLLLADGREEVDVVADVSPFLDAHVADGRFAAVAEVGLQLVAVVHAARTTRIAIRLQPITEGKLIQADRHHHVVACAKIFHSPSESSPPIQSQLNRAVIWGPPEPIKSYSLRQTDVSIEIHRCFRPPPVFNNNQWITNRSNQSLQFWNLSRSQGSCGIIQLCSIADAENLGTVRNRSQLEIGWEYWGLWKLSSRSFPDNSNWFVVGKWNILSRLLASRLVLFCFGPPRCSRWNWSGRN